jgi:hypothetical protein
MRGIYRTNLSTWGRGRRHNNFNKKKYVHRCVQLDPKPNNEYILNPNLDGYKKVVNWESYMTLSRPEYTETPTQQIDALTF